MTTLKQKALLQLMRAEGIPEPEQEYEFHHERRWRFDYCWPDPDFMLAWEIQGGIYTRGRHVRGAALEKEYEKLTAAATCGYRVVFCTPDTALTVKWMRTLKRALYG